MKRLDEETFCECKNLKRIEIPKAVEYIGAKCFNDSGIEKITLPSTLREIGENVFNTCPNLKTIWVEKGCTLDIKAFVDENVKVRRK